MKKLLKTLIILLFFIQTAVAQRSEGPAPQPAPELKETFKLGMAGFTFYLQICSLKNNPFSSLLQNKN